MEDNGRQWKTMEDFVNVNFHEWLNELKIGRLKKSILFINVGFPCI